MHVFILNSDFPYIFPEEEEPLLPVNLHNTIGLAQDLAPPPVFNIPPQALDPIWDNWANQVNNVHANRLWGGGECCQC